MRNMVKKIKEFVMESRKTHLINDNGEKIVVDTREFNNSQQNGDGKYDGYHVDIDWYLNNGYITAWDYRKQLNHFDG